MKTKLSILLFLLLGSFLSEVFALDIYVSTVGADSNLGTINRPLATFRAAQEKARAFAGKESVVIHFADGIYYLPETIIFKPEDAGSELYPITYRAQNEGGAVLSGGSQLELKWLPIENGIYKAETPDELVVDQVFINGQNQRMARYPNYDPLKKAEPYQGYAADAFSKERTVNWKNPKGGYIHAMHAKRWGGYHYLITGKDNDHEITYKGGWQNNRQMGMHDEYRMVENIFEELDAEGEWYHSRNTNTLYYKPPATIDLANAKVEVVRLKHLIEFKGTNKKPVKHIILKGFVVRHAARTFMDSKEPLLRSDWTIYRGGAFFLTGTEDIQILDTEFDQLGGNAIFINNYNRNTLVRGCHIHDTGGSGVCFVGDPNAVRDPLFEYHETNDLYKIDRTPGPKTDNYPSDGTVEDCLIHGIGRVERQVAGVQISMSQSITVRDVSIYDCSRAGINVSEGTWGGHMIEGCDVFDTVLETHDHGSFNSWGRDRYWHKDRKISQVAIQEDSNLPFIDAVKTTTIRNSRWRCDHGWDIDLDDGSSNYDIYNNLMLNNGLKLREGFRRHAWNNITVNNGLHPHVWYENSKDQVFSNIFMAPHKPVRVKKNYKDETTVDLFFVDQSIVMEKSVPLGWDDNSVFGDPMFVNPANGDFRVSEASPAFEIGFKNFPMNRFGVKKASLKAIARTPVISTLKIYEREFLDAAGTKLAWFGAVLSNVSGVEYSAYGISAEDGGLVLSNVTNDSQAASLGFLNGDLIQGLMGNSVSNVKQFKRLMSNAVGTVYVKVIRNQQEIEIGINF